MIQIGASPATLDRPLDHLMACHRRIEQRLDALVRAAGFLESDRSRALDAIVKSIQFMDSNGVLHTEDEEQTVFPRLRLRLSPEEAVIFHSLEAQHQEAESIFSKLKMVAARLDGAEPASKRLSGEYFECAVRLRSLYRDHIRSEDELFSRLVQHGLPESELAEISSEMRARRARRS